MGALYLGTSKVRNVYIGGTKVRQIYLGTSKVFNAGVVFWIGNTRYEFEDGTQMYTIDHNESVRFDEFDNADYKLTVCLIGGGGAGGGSIYCYDYNNGNSKTTGGGGGEGGEVKIQEFVPTVGNTYSIVVGTGGIAPSGDGNSTTAFGLTALFGHGGPTPDANWGGQVDGGSGNPGADGGKSGEIYWGGWANWSYSPTNGADGTLFNGTYYGGGANGGRSTNETERQTDAFKGLGGDNYGGGGYGGRRHYNSELLGPQNGLNGAVLLLLQKR